MSQPFSVDSGGAVTMRLQIAVADVAQMDAELKDWLKRAYAQNA
jgi:hypothetical protein